MTSSQQLIQEILEQADALFSMPGAALQVCKALSDSDVTARELSKIITADPALTAQILRVCNSAVYGFSRKIDTITEAIAVLGLNELRRVVYTVLSQSALHRPVEGYGLAKGDLWDNALSCAVYARHIARRVQAKNEETVFIAALIRDIGKVALENHVRGKREMLEGNAIRNRTSFSQAEEEVIGVNHMELGAVIAERWRLPAALIAAIRYHHAPHLMPEDSSLEEQKLVAIVHLADIFTMMTGCGLGVDGLMYPLDYGVFKILGIPQDGAIMESLFSELLALQDDIAQTAASLTVNRG